MNNDSLLIYLKVYGRLQLDLLRDFTLPTMMWPENLPACGLKSIYVDCYGLPAESSELEDILASGLSGIERTIAFTARSPESLGQGVARAHALGLRMFNLPVDMIFGNSSIRNLVNYSRHKHLVAAAGHLRVDWRQFLERFTPDSFKLPLSNAELVSLAMECPHHTAANSWSDLDNSTLKAGISLTRISPALVTMIHHLPSPWLASFTSEDVEFLSAHGEGAWDHNWLQLLARQGRLRVMGSSELCFGIELTHDEASRPPVEPGSANQELKFEQAGAATDLCHQFVTSLRQK